MPVFAPRIAASEAERSAAEEASRLLAAPAICIAARPPMLHVCVCLVEERCWAVLAGA